MMGQDASWYGGRPRAWPHCVSWGPAPPRGTAPSQFLAVCCGQTARWIKMPLGAEVGLGPGHIVLDGDPAPPKNGHSPYFSPHVYCGQTAGLIRMPLGTVVDLGQGHIVLDGAHLSHRKGAQQPSPLFSPCLVCPNGCPSRLLLSSCIDF